MKNERNYVAIITAVLLGLLLAAVIFLFTSFVNMYVWNNVLTYFFDLKRISLLGGFGIGVVLSIITTDIPGSGNADDGSSIYYLFLSRGLILLFAWLFTLFI